MISKVMQKRQELLAAVLELVEEMVNKVEQSGIQIKKTYPKDYKKFREYIEAIDPETYKRWCKFVGCIVTPMSYTEGNNHLAIFDNGIFSNHIASIPRLHYSRESALLTKHVFGIDRRVHPIGAMHIHIINSQKLLDENNGDVDNLVFALKKMVDQKHEYMEDKNCRLVRVSSGRELETVEGWQLQQLLKNK